MKIFVAEKQYRRIHPLSVPLIIAGANNTFYCTCIPPPPFPHYRAGRTAVSSAPIYHKLPLFIRWSLYFFVAWFLSKRHSSFSFRSTYNSPDTIFGVYYVCLLMFLCFIINVFFFIFHLYRIATASLPSFVSFRFYLCINKFSVAVLCHLQSTPRFCSQSQWFAAYKCFLALVCMNDTRSHSHAARQLYRPTLLLLNKCRARPRSYVTQSRPSWL